MTFSGYSNSVFAPLVDSECSSFKVNIAWKLY